MKSIRTRTVARRSALDRRCGNAKFNVSLDKLPSSTHPLEAKIAVRMSEPGGRAVERAITLPVTANGNMIGVSRSSRAARSPMGRARISTHRRCAQ